MHIAIIGAGNVGRALANGWAAKGHQIAYGVRDVNGSKLADIDRAKFAVASVADAVKSASVVLLSTPWGATRDALAACGDLRGKTVLDATNPLLPMLAGLDHADGKSGGQKVAEWARGAHVVKIFNSTGFNNMANPRYGAAASMMIYCGDDAGAKATAKGLAEDLGFDPVDFGPLANAGYSENVAMTWIWLAIKGGRGREMAFVLARR
jgi:8-hydroxy-5-deazaflavin:NADPH oxidoreductase